MARRLIWSLAAIAIAVATACGNGSSSAPSKTIAGGTVNVRISGDWNTMNPYIVANSNAGVLFTGLYDRLVQLAPDQKTILPYVAKSWKASPTEIVFTIRQGVTCSDGTPMNAANVAASLRSLTRQAQAVRTLGAGPYTVTSDDAAQTVTLTLGTPFGDALVNLSQPTGSLVCPAEQNLIAQNVSDRVVGSGPYTMVDAVHSDHVTMQARPDWNWGPSGATTKDSGFPSTVVVKIVGNETTAANELIAGGLDVASVSGPDVTRLVADRTLHHSTYGGSYLSPLVFNQITPGALMKDDTVRQAVFTAVDPRAFLQADTGGFGITGPSILAPSAQCYDGTTSKDQPAHTVTAAQKVLTSAGYTLGSDGKLSKDGKPVPLRILSTGANFGQGPEYLADTLNKVGFNVTLSNPDFQTYVTQLTTLQYDVATEYLSGGLLPSSSALYISGPTAFSKKGTNQSGNEDPAVYQAALAAMKESGSAACRDWSQFQHLLLQHHDLLPLDQRTQQFFGKGFAIQEPSGYLWISSIRRTA